MTVEEEQRDGNGRGIPVVSSDISYSYFLNHFLRPLKPCLVSGLTEGWSAAIEWTTVDPLTAALIPNFSALRARFGSFNGCVTFCATKDSNGDALQEDMLISQFIDNVSSNSHENLFTSTTRRYLKDFHFMRVNPSLKSPYSVPIFFQGILS
jgi:hypothetical protein